ncbi:MAG: N-acetylmuramoyl-L-alanine amidase [Selenomonadaceae bacterium]|nr:N-acetylmuramoyl-L-alanine amidase [Selenomonadaceae bacterium]MBR1860005.1 N-acetylmuramoyl-L-alanine amidase [Selenomonadaceae bacterium]
MNRRDFLKYAAAATLGMYINPFDESIAKASVLETAEPVIYKRLLQFTEYEKRLSTEFIVIHHTVYPGDEHSDVDTTATDIHELHQKKNKWAGIGYHYLIRKDGMIERGRLPDMVGAHALHHNLNSVGICLAGNFEIGKPTKAQMRSVKELTAWLCRKYDLDPYKEGTIVGHRDLNDTKCPGENLYRRLDDIRSFCINN